MSERQSRFLSLSAVLLVAAFVPAGRAQTGTQTTVMASPSGPWFSVDGTTYFSAMSAFWPAGSSHTLSVSQGIGYSYNLDSTIQWQFGGWSWSGGSSQFTSIQVIANPAITSYTANFNAQYLLTVQSACNPAPCTSGLPGVVTVNQNLPTSGPLSPWSTWQSPNGSASLQAIAGGGWLFQGWQVGNGALITGSSTYIANMTTPLTVTAVFAPAKTVNFATNPPNLSFYADGGLVYAPTSAEWFLGSSHLISGLNLTNDGSGKHWVFASWSDGGAQSHTYVVGNTTAPETITATYAPAASVNFRSSPPNLALVVDNLVLPPPYSYIWGVGATHTISATTPQKDSQGNTWVFQSWDDLVTTPSRTITVPVGADVNSYELTALFTQQASLTVKSTIAGQVVTIDGTSCTTPCTVSRNPGVQIHVTAPATAAVSSNSRQDLLGWATGSGAPVTGDWIGTLSTASTTITATYHLMNSLTTTLTPSKSATWRLVPNSTDGYYDSQAKVEIHILPRPGYRFSGWGGDLSGSEPSGSLSMNMPHTVTAALSSTASISRGGVVNGAGIGTVPGVASGSVATIYGENLIPESVVGPADPLAHNLGGVSVHVGTRSLPIYFASPTQINFQIPADFAPGPHTLTVRADGTPDVTSQFSIVRNAPGLFPAVIDGQTYAMVMHEDGSPVSASSPARQGELLTAYGTGFGPTDHVRPEGTAVPASPRFMLLDAVKVQAGDAVFSPESSYAAPGRIGIDLVQFRLDGTAPSGAAIPFTLTVNGIKSNTLNLPIQ